MANSIDMDSFRDYVRSQERRIDNLDGLKRMIIPVVNDNEKSRALKAAFKTGCEAFLKYFAINWVFAENIRNTQGYLRHRFKLLRKIKELTAI